MKETPAENKDPMEPIVNKGPLPDPFLVAEGQRVASRDEWTSRATAWRNQVIEMEYGGMPPPPDSVDIETLCHSGVRRWPGKPGLWSYRVHCRGGQQPFQFVVRILFPKDRQEPVPAIIAGDDCWWYISDAIAQQVVERGCALVMFNRTEMAEDLGYSGVQDKQQRSGGLYEVYPGLTFGALAAWAWGYHRVVDLLQHLDFIDPARIAVTGHSRGGKTVLVAAATDERIALANDNGSCAGGSSTYRYVGAGGETLNIINAYPSWFGPGLRPFVGREEDLPFDQHCLLAAIAPRLLLTTYALDDRWSNPEGMVQCHRATQEVYRYLDAKNNLAFHLRPGPHQHAPEDWKGLLDFIGLHWQQREPQAVFNRHPYHHLPTMFSWRAPVGVRVPGRGQPTAAATPGKELRPGRRAQQGS